jgi:hypothetical protein
MEKFESEPLKNYLSAHTKLNNYIKVSTVAVDYLYNAKENNEELSTLISDLILESGERWRPRKIKDSKNELNVLKNNLSKTGVIWVYSAFDVFFKKVEGILSGFFVKVEEVNNSESDEEKSSKIIELYKKLDWNTDQIEDLIPILKFYQILRHLVAHNIGLPNDSIYEFSRSEEFNLALKKWKTKYPKKTISPPPIVKIEEIVLKPHHSIIYSETCLRIAKDINSKIFNQLGLKFFVEKTIKKHLTDAKKLSAPSCTNFQRYIVYHLKNDYCLTIKKYNEVFDFYDNNPNLNRDKKRYIALKELI